MAKPTDEHSFIGQTTQPALFGPEGRPPYAGKSVQTPGYGDWDRQRWLAEPPKSSYRSDYERDRARVLHSSALRRLAAKTQVISPDDDDFARNRLTHSLEVAQVGRELGRSLGCDPDVVDAACLSHDLGHPPFGHNGEKALDNLAEEAGGFEGNAQTLRLLARLEPKKIFDDGTSAGLNLTRASLDAACKYPWRREEAPQGPGGEPVKKFGVYEDDLDVFNWVRHGITGRGQSMESQVMDLADDISYSVHDVEDGIVSGRFQLSWLRNDVQREKMITTAQQWYVPDVPADAIDAALSRLENTQAWVWNAEGTRASRAKLKDMTSQLIGRFSTAAFNATREVYGNEPLTRHNAQVVVPEETQLEIMAMKAIAATYVMSAENRQPLYARQREVLTDLTEFLVSTGSRYLDPIYAQDWEEAETDAGRLRAIIDQVASLTDVSALAWHGHLVLGQAEPTRIS